MSGGRGSPTETGRWVAERKRECLTASSPASVRNGRLLEEGALFRVAGSDVYL